MIIMLLFFASFEPIFRFISMRVEHRDASFLSFLAKQGRRIQNKNLHMKRQKTALLQNVELPQKSRREDEDGDLLLGQIKATGLFHFLWPSLALARNYQSHLSLYLLFAQIGKCCDCPTFHFYLKAKLYSMYLTIQSRDVATISKLFFQQCYLNAKTAQRERDPDSRLHKLPPASPLPSVTFYIEFLQRNEEL